MKKSLAYLFVFLGLVFSGNAHAKIVKFENCFNVQDNRNYTGYFSEVWKPTNSYNKQQFDYWEILINIKTFEAITNYQFSKKAHQHFSHLPRRISRHMFNTKKYPYLVNTDNQTGEIYYTLKFEDTFWGTKKEKYNKELISSGYDWSDVYEYSIFDITNGIIEKNQNLLNGTKRKVITKCSSKLKFYNFITSDTSSQNKKKLYYDATTKKMKACIFETTNGTCSAFAPYDMSNYDFNTLFYNEKTDSMQKCSKELFGKCLNFLPQTGIIEKNQLFYNKRTRSMTTCLNSNNKGKCLAFGMQPLKRNRLSSGSYIVDSKLNPYYKKVPNTNQLIELGLRMLSGACTLGRDC